MDQLIQVFKEKRQRDIKESKFLFLIFYAGVTLFFINPLFAQTDNAERISVMRDGLREEYTQQDYESFLIKMKEGKINDGPEIVDNTAATDALVNNNTGSSGTSYFTQSETSILAFGNTVLIGFNDSGSYGTGGNNFTGWSRSTDGGATFVDGGLLPTNTGGDGGDPVLARNETTGRIYFSTLGLSVSTIQVFRSDDGGATWTLPVNGTPGGSGEDKQWLTVDNYSGTGNGYVYLISRRFGGTTGIYMHRSIDNGATFSAGVLIASAATGNVQGAFVTVGPDHSVYAFYFDDVANQLKVRKSTDQGVTFSATVTVATGLVGGTNGDLGLTGLRQGTVTYSGFRSNEFPHIVVNPVSGHIYVTYGNDGTGTDKADVFMVISSDGGLTWSAPVRVNDDVTTTDQWMPTIAVLPSGNKLGIFYYSRQEDPTNNNLFKYYGRIGSISGSSVTFDPSFAISDVASLPEFGRDGVVNTLYMGDYNHAAATANTFHVVWSDNRDDLPGGAPRKDPNVYYEKIDVGPAQFLVWEGVLGGQDFSGTYIKNFLTGLSYTVDYTSAFPADLTPYQAVFLSFGNFPANTVLDNTKATILQTYLETGGRVYLEGGDALDFDQATNIQLHNLFGLGAGADGGTNVIDGLQGQVGSITDGMLFTSSTQLGNNWIDIYLPYTGKLAFNESGYGNVAVQNSGAFDQKTFCFSYALAYLTDGSFPNTKNELMTRILNYLIGTPELPPDISVSPSSFTFTVDAGGSDSDILTINNLGQQGLAWNIFEQDPTTTAKLKLQDGRELPVDVKLKFDWSQSIKGEDYVPLAPSTGPAPSGIKFKPLYGYEPFESSALVGTDAFATETQTLNYVQFDLNLPTVLNNISSFPDIVWAGDFGIDLSFAYAVNSVTNKFIKINKTTGVVTEIGPCTPTQNPSFEFFSGMAVDPTTGIPYLSSSDNVTSWLYTVNISTGAPSLIGVITNSPITVAIAINNNGQMYGYDVITDVMVSINKSTAAGTVLGPLGFDANFGQGMDFDPITGTLYLSAFNNSTFQAELRIGNTTTGSTTFVGVLGSTTPGGLLQLGWVGLPGEPFDCTWLAENPVAGVIQGGGNQVVDITVDATGLTPGTYNCDLVISSNDPDEPSVIVPVTLNVREYADVNVTPTVLTFVVPEGGSDTQSLTVANIAPTGATNLDWSLTEQPPTLGPNNVEMLGNLNMSNNSNQRIGVSKTVNENVKGNSSLFTEIKSNTVENYIFKQNNLSNGSGSDINSVVGGHYGSIPTNVGPECSGGLIYDDGTVENGYGSSATDARIVTSIIPPYYPYNITQVCINWTTFNVDPNINYNIVVYDDDGAGGAPGTLLATIPVSAMGVPTWTGFAFYDYDVTGLIPPITSGSVYVGAQWNATAEPSFFICSDESPASPLHLGYYYDGSGVWQTIDAVFTIYKAMFIRVESIVDIPWISENPLNGTVPASSNQNVDVSVNATGLTAGTYRCNLIIASNDPDENPVVVPVILVVTSGPPPNNFGIVTNYEDRNIHIINADNNTIVGPLLSGSLGNGLLLDPVISPDGQKALISNFDDQTVYFVDIANPYSLSVAGSASVGFLVEDIALTPDGAYALVTDGGSSTKIGVINVGTMSLIQTLDITPRGVLAVDIAPDGTVLVADYGNNKIHVLSMNLSTGLLTDLSTAINVGSGPLNVTVGPDGQTALVATFNSTSIDVLQITAPGSVTLIGSIPNILNAQSIAFEKNGNRAFVVQTGTSPDALAVLTVNSPGNVVDTGTRVNLISDVAGGLFGVDAIDISADGDWAYVGNPTAFLPNTAAVAVVNLNSYTLAPGLTAGNFPTGVAISGASTFSFTIDVYPNKWNMVSAPGTNPAGMGVGIWWPSFTGNVWSFNGITYVNETPNPTTPGVGYWMKHGGVNTTYSYSDIDMVAHDPIPGHTSWNIIGVYEDPVAELGIDTNPIDQRTGTIWGFNGITYVNMAGGMLQPGYGYWIKLLSACDIILEPPLGKVSGEVAEEYFKDDWGRITLTDAAGISYTLYAVKGEVDLNQYEMPPVLPEGMFDIRFSSGRVAEDINSSVKTIDMQGITYPLTVRAEGMDMRLMDESGKTVNVNLKSGEDVVISDATIQKLMVTGELLPTVYALEQNYPNPFNPSTVIEFSLPEDVSNVKLSIYNALGEKVAELVNAGLTAGRYSYTWNAENAATGMYIYELRTNSFVSVKKMLLLK